MNETAFWLLMNFEGGQTNYKQNKVVSFSRTSELYVNIYYAITIFGYVILDHPFQTVAELT